MMTPKFTTHLHTFQISLCHAQTLIETDKQMPKIIIST